MKNHLLFLLLLASFQVFSQDNRIAQTNTPLSEVERLVMPTLDNDALLETELEARVPGRAPHFAESFEVSISPDTHGNWEMLENGNAVWRLRILSSNAKSLNLGFSKYIMPSGGSLVLYSPDFKRIRGPFTPADNEEHEELWTPIVEGDDLVIEVQMPQENIGDLELELKTINHDFIGFGNPTELLSGSCNLDVICTEADGWGIVDGYRDIIQSVAVISTGGGTFCTGFLINNARQDCTPYFMTADHCGIGVGQAPSLVTYWNFQNSTCREPGSGASGGSGDGTLNDFNTGAIHRASWPASDMTIVEMDDPISPTANAFFAGWDATDAIAQSAIAVHHPSTDEKRISFENDPTNYGTYEGAPAEDPNGDHVIIQDWDIGTTEPGSSGSPLFNADHRVIGQLHGGFAACGNNSYDAYGAIRTSWEGGGTAATRLKDWLDPDNTGVLVLDGRTEMQCALSVDATPTTQSICAETSVTFELAISENFISTVDLSLQNLPAGVTANFSTNPVAPGATSTLTLTNTETLTEGNYIITLMGTDGTQIVQSDLTINVFTDIPNANNLTSPPNMGTDVSPAPIFEWNTANADAYDFELATDISFTNIITTATALNNATFATQGLDTETLYFWRIRSSNFCGMGDWSEAYQFTTGSCSFDISANVPVNISSDGTPTITSTIEIGYSAIVTDLNLVDLVGLHSWLADLTFILTSPSGTQVTLVTEQCNNNDNFDISFDDQAETGELPCPYTDGNTYQPLEALAAFNGEDVQGTWTLTVIDDANEDGGTLQNWALQICSSPIVDISVAASPANLNLCLDGQGIYEVVVGQDFMGDVIVSATSEPAGLPINFAANITEPGGTVTAALGDLSGIAPNDYTIIFSATDGVNTTMTTTSLMLEDVPTATDLDMPVDNMIAEVLMPNFSWDAVAGTTDYFIEIATDPEFTSIVNSANTATNAFNQATSLEELTTYYWRVSTSNSCGEAMSSTNNFTTLVDVEISSNPTNLNLCTADQGVYEITVDENFTGEVTVSATSNPTGLTIDFTNNTTQPGGTVSANLDNLFGAAPGAYSITFTATDGTYTTTTTTTLDLAGPPLVSNLAVPTNNMVDEILLPTFSWSAIDNADGYFIEIATDEDFNNIINSANTTATTFNQTTDLINLTTYYWRVSATNDCGTSLSVINNFTTEMVSGVNDLEGVSVLISPNPTNGLVNVQFGQALDRNINLEVYGLNGQLLQERQVANGAILVTLNLGNYPAGIYLVKLKSDTDVLVKRIAVQ